MRVKISCTSLVIKWFIECISNETPAILGFESCPVGDKLFKFAWLLAP